jgi:hypothetical protein
VLRRWIEGPGPNVELAETAAVCISTIADGAGPDGWRLVADQWLQADYESCHQLLYSQSQHA